MTSIFSWSTLQNKALFYQNKGHQRVQGKYSNTYNFLPFISPGVSVSVISFDTGEITFNHPPPSKASSEWLHPRPATWCLEDWKRWKRSPKRNGDRFHGVPMVGFSWPYSKRWFENILLLLLFFLETRFRTLRFLMLTASDHHCLVRSHYNRI